MTLAGLPEHAVRMGMVVLSLTVPTMTVERRHAQQVEASEVER